MPAEDKGVVNMQFFSRFFLFLALIGRTALPASSESVYRLGPDDKILFRSPQVEELNEKTSLVSKEGSIDLPLAGKVQVGGLSVAEAQQQVSKLLERYYYHPLVSVEVVDYASQPVSVLGAVTNSGIYQLRGNNKTVADVLAMAAGLQPQAGYTVRVTRKRDGQTISYNLRDILQGGRLHDTAIVEPFDVITVPRAELIYVIGEVRKPGGFTLGEKEHASVLQALALAEGPQSTAALRNCMVLRSEPGQTDRRKIKIDVKQLLAGKAVDPGMQADDILVIPSSTAHKVGIRTAEAALQTISGVVIWRGL
jgi:polysaccharide export outer membrane protein